MKVTVIDLPPGSNDGRVSKPAPKMGYDPHNAACKLAGCDTVIPRGNIVCGPHDGYRCSFVMQPDSNHVAARRCRGPAKPPAEHCWRHKDRTSEETDS